VDADGIPLYPITHWQKAQFLDQMCGARVYITLPPNWENAFRGNTSQKDGILGSASKNVAFC
jgi:hypothetical protein